MVPILSRWTFRIKQSSDDQENDWIHHGVAVVIGGVVKIDRVIGV